MIKPRRRPEKTRRIVGSFGEQVPAVIEAYVLTLIQQAAAKADELEAHAVSQKIRYGIAIEHVPTRMDFEKAFLSKRAHPAEIRFDQKTDRIYLVGIGLPGREELTLHHLPVQNRYGETAFYQMHTESELKDDAVLTYTEIDWDEYRTAYDVATEMEPFVRQGLARYFELPPHYVPGLILATPGLDRDDYHRIAMYALDPRTGA